MKVTLYLRSGSKVSFRCSSFKTNRNAHAEMTSWEATGIKGLSYVSVSPSDIEMWTTKHGLLDGVPSLSSLWPFGKKSLVLVDRGETFIQVIKQIRAHFGIPLKDAKDIVDRVQDGEEVELIPSTDDKARLREVKEALEGAGATVRLS